MTTYKPTRTYKAWGIVLFGAAIILTTLNVSNYVENNMDLSSLFVMVGITIVLVIIGLGHFMKKVTLGVDTITTTHYITRTAHFSEILAMREVSKPHYKNYGEPQNATTGKTYALEIVLQQRPLFIKDVRSLEHYEELYDALEKRTHKTIERKVKDWTVTKGVVIPKLTATKKTKS